MLLYRCMTARRTRVGCCYIGDYKENLCMLLYRWLHGRPMYVVVLQMSARRTCVCCCSTNDCKENLCMLLFYR